jgi:hypothetical protein
MKALFLSAGGRRCDLLDRIVAPNFVRHCQGTPQADVRSLGSFKD